MIYVYNCDACGEFEITQSIKEDALTVCPTCGGKCWRVPTLTQFNCVGQDWAFKQVAKEHKKRHGKG